MRPRSLEDEGEVMARAIAIAGELVTMLGEELAAWVVLECERGFWQARNVAAQC